MRFTFQRKTTCDAIATTNTTTSMSSHVPFLAVRPDDQYSTDVKTRDFAVTTASTDPIAVAMDAVSRNTPARASHLSPYIRFPLVCIISLGLSSLLYSLVSDLSGYQFATASRRLDADWQVGALVVWKVVQLGVAWTAGYDCTFGNNRLP